MRIYETGKDYSVAEIGEVRALGNFLARYNGPDNFAIDEDYR